MNIQIDEEIIRKIKEINISLEEYLILSLMYNKEWDLLNLYDKNSSDTRIIILYQKLYRDGFIKTSSSEDDNLFCLTEKSVKLFEE